MTPGQTQTPHRSPGRNSPSSSSPASSPRVGTYSLLGATGQKSGTQAIEDDGEPFCGSPGSALPSDSQERKQVPLASGCFDYFPAALAEVAKVSWVGNEKHNPGEPMHHARDKSMDHPDALLRHFESRGGFDTVSLPDGRTFQVRHSAEMAWRSLALLQEELEAAGAPLARGAKQS